MDSISLQTNSRDLIMNEIANHAATVRRTFEAHQTKRKHTVSSATAAAAHHMASLNRKRKFENNLAIRATTAATNIEGGAQSEFIWNRSSHTFHSPIACFTRPEKMHNPCSNSSANHTNEAAHIPRVSDGIILKASPQDITVSYNDVVCGKGKTTSNLVGNQRYKVWINLHKEAFAKAPYEEDRQKIACSIVITVATSVPQGRFVSLDIHTGLWYDVGYERAAGITLETLMAVTGMMKNHGMMDHPLRVFTSKAA